MFPIILFAILIVSSLLWMFMRWSQVKNYWLDRGVPHLSPHLILGSLTFVLRENMALWLIRLYEQLKSPYIGIWLMWKPALIINSPELARRILIQDFSNFRDRYVRSGFTDPIGSLNLFTVNDPIWSSVRKNLTNIFTTARLKNQQNYSLTKSRELVQRIKNEGDNRVNLKDLFVDYTTDVIGTFAFGVESNATLTGKGPLRNVTKDFMKFTIYRGLSLFSIFFLPDIVDIFRFKFFPRSSTNYFGRAIEHVLADRKNKNIQRPDLIDALIKIQNESDNKNEKLPKGLLVAQAAVFLLAGFDTSATTLTYAIYEIAHHPRVQWIFTINRVFVSILVNMFIVKYYQNKQILWNENANTIYIGQRFSINACYDNEPTGNNKKKFFIWCEKPCQEKLYQELREAQQHLGTEDFDMQTLGEMTYMNCVISETLRKYSPMGWIDRIAIADYEIDEKLTIKAGTPVYINAIGMQYDPNYFQDPYKFNPDRFLPENKNNLIPYTFLPFGEGPRNCIGQRFAFMSVRSALVALFLSYKVQPFPNTPSPNEVKIDKISLFYTPGEFVSVDFIPRN